MKIQCKCLAQSHPNWAIEFQILNNSLGIQADKAKIYGGGRMRRKEIYGTQEDLSKVLITQCQKIMKNKNLRSSRSAVQYST